MTWTYFYIPPLYFPLLYIFVAICILQRTCAGKLSILQLSAKTCLSLAVVNDVLDLKKLLMLIAALQHHVFYYSFSCPVSSCLFSFLALFWNVVFLLLLLKWKILVLKQCLTHTKMEQEGRASPVLTFHTWTLPPSGPHTSTGVFSKLVDGFQSVLFLLLLFLWVLTNPFSLGGSESRSRYFIVTSGLSTACALTRC